ncbi:hypothetical protein [Bacteroides heparinolyticus]|uniref:hypothetical protein n=1 Tax=Prevotella heparinolytica TaxID=28113 RepID=UPI0035A04289
MTAEQVKETLSSNREMVIEFFNANVKKDNFYTLKWFMSRVLQYATLAWARRVNVGEKEINSILKTIMKDYPQIANGYVSNYQKAVNYFGEEKVRMMLNGK